MLEIKEKDFNTFFNVPFEIYSDDLGYVSPFKSDLKRFLSVENPIFKSVDDFTFFTAIRDGKLVGRIVAHIHHASNEKFQTNNSYFGMFDCIDDKEVSNKLLELAEGFGKKHGCQEILGNFNFTAMQQSGVLVKAYKNYHYSDQVYGPEYLQRLLENSGYNGFFPMSTYEFILDNFNEEDLLGEKQKNILKSDNFKVQRVTKSNVRKEFDSIRICLNDGFSENPMFVPLTKEEMDDQSKDMMLIIDNYLTFVTYEESRPAGALVCIPDLNPFLRNIKSQIGLSTPYHFIKHKMNPDRAIIIFYSVCQDFHGMGINSTMLYQLVKNLKKRGYKSLGITWIASDNKASLRMMEKLGASRLHDLLLFKKGLQG